MFEQQSITDLILYTPKIHRDSRGFFMESYNKKLFFEGGICCDFVQDNHSLSQKGCLRGLHFQTGEAAQAKLVTVLQGAVLDVAVDIRPDSETYLQHVAVHLDDQNKQQFFIPRGFAHGFLVLSDQAHFHYKVDSFYDPSAESGLRHDDPQLKISWPEPESLFLAEKDTKWPLL